MSSTSKVLKINKATEAELDAIAYIQKYTGEGTSARAMSEAITSYPYHVKKIKDLERQIEELSSWKLDALIKINDFYKADEALKGLLNKK
ncbi:MAG: hypothetical protein ACK5KL_19395 [Dysgonomonas sp.]